MPFAKPSDYMKLHTDMAQLTYQSNSVIAMRMLGFAGFWGASPFEAWDMVTEKQDAAFGSAFKVAKATMSGARPDQVAQAAMEPYQDKARANQVRLSKRGPRV